VARWPRVLSKGGYERIRKTEDGLGAGPRREDATMILR